MEVEDLYKNYKNIKLETLLKLRDIAQDDMVAKRQEFIEAKEHFLHILSEIEDRVGLHGTF